MNPTKHAYRCYPAKTMNVDDDANDDGDDVGGNISAVVVGNLPHLACVAVAVVLQQPMLRVALLKAVFAAIETRPMSPG